MDALASRLSPHTRTSAVTKPRHRLILISCDVKNMEKTATSTWHYVNRLVPKNDYKMIIKHPRLIIKQHGTIKNYRYVGDVSGRTSPFVAGVFPLLAHLVSSGPEKVHKKFRCIWTPFGIDFLRCKKQAENNNWHWALCQQVSTKKML